MKRPLEQDYASLVAYTRALEQYCDALNMTTLEGTPINWNKAITEIKEALAQPPQRTWVGIEQSDMPSDPDPMYDHEYFIAGMVYANYVLKEKNT